MDTNGRLCRDVSCCGHPRWATRSDARAWRRISTTAGFDRADVHTLVRHDGRLIALGAHHGDMRATAWTTTDGKRWPTANLPAAGVVTGAASAGKTLLAVGSLADGETAESAGILVLASRDAGRWTLDTPADHWLALRAGTVMTAVARVRNHWLAATSSIDGARLWESGDGTTWRATPGPARAGVVISALTATRDGAVVAAGSSVVGTRPLVWRRSAHGKWSEIASPSARVPQPPGDHRRRPAQRPRRLRRVARRRERARIRGSADLSRGPQTRPASSRGD